MRGPQQPPTSRVINSVHLAADVAMIQCRYCVITSDMFYFTHYNYFRYDESAVPMMAGSAGLAMSADVRISGPGGLPAQPPHNR